MQDSLNSLKVEADDTSPKASKWHRRYCRFPSNKKAERQKAPGSEGWDSRTVEHQLSFRFKCFCQTAMTENIKGSYRWAEQSANLDGETVLNQSDPIIKRRQGDNRVMKERELFCLSGESKAKR